MTEDEYRTALNNIADSFGTLTQQVNRAFEAGRKQGLNDMQIGNDIRMRLKGIVSIDTVRRMLPETAKHQEKVRDFARKMPANSEPKIPPPPQVIQEIQEVEPEPPKAIYDEPIHIPEHEITLNCRKFGTEIRMGLLNNAILKLRIDKLNQVTFIGR